MMEGTASSAGDILLVEALMITHHEGGTRVRLSTGLAAARTARSRSRRLRPGDQPSSANPTNEFKGFSGLLTTSSFCMLK